jgi:mono/diheme cytochrome c family protein
MVDGLTNLAVSNFYAGTAGAPRVVMQMLKMTIALLLTACAADHPDDATGDDLDGKADDARGAEQQRELDEYIEQHAEGYQAFMYGSFGSLGAPYLVYRLAAEMFPEIWGENMAGVGMFAAPDPGHALPLGLGFQPSDTAIPTPAGPVTLNVVTFTCAACHVGKVVGPRGREQLLIGAPATTSRGFFAALAAMVNDPRFTADNFRAVIAAKPPGWFYGDPSQAAQEAAERAVFTAPGVTEAFLDQIRAATNATTSHLVTSVLASTYRNDDPSRIFGMPGSNDEFTFIAQAYVKPGMSASEIAAIMPPAPAPSDLMSVFRRAGTPANWDGSNNSPIHRGLSPGVGNQSDPTKVNVETGVFAGLFVEGLPPPPYPFGISARKAARGAVLYKKYCGSCHDSATSSSSPAEVGTDPNRARALPPTLVSEFVAGLHAACEGSSLCPDVPDDQMFQATGVYKANRLDGIWSRAPYLHNGSVPTLRHLLIPASRPTSFVRGNVNYDAQSIGFVWNQDAPGSAIYDTTLSGNSNRGHDTRAYLGLDWSKRENAGKLADLLAYLTTL